MNIYYIDMGLVINSYWKYLIDVLKVSHVISLVHPDMMDPVAKEQFLPYLRLDYDYNKYPSYKNFLNKCVYEIADIIYAQIKQFEEKGEEPFKDSSHIQVRKNLKTNDKNILIVENKWGNSEYIRSVLFHPKYVSEETYDISRHLTNLIKKQLKTNQYEEKICQVNINLYGLIIDLYFENYRPHYPICNYNYAKKKWYPLVGFDRIKQVKNKYSLLQYINSLLHNFHPDVFPLWEDKKGKKHYKVFWDNDSGFSYLNSVIKHWEEEKRKEEEYEERMEIARRKEEDDWENSSSSDDECSWGSFLEEIGESSVNIIDC